MTTARWTNGMAGGRRRGTVLIFVLGILVMLALTLALFVMGRSMQTHGTINRIEGTLLRTCFITYQGWIVWQSHVGGPT